MALFSRAAPLSDADFMLGICAQRRVAVCPSNWITSTREGQQKAPVLLCTYTLVEARIAEKTIVSSTCVINGLHLNSTHKKGHGGTARTLENKKEHSCKDVQRVSWQSGFLL